MKNEFKEFNVLLVEVIKGLFSKDQTLLMQDLNVKKGIVANIGHFLWLIFILPLKLLNIIINIDYPIVNFVDRLAMTGVMVFKAGDSTITQLSDTYHRFVSSILKKNEHIEADISSISGFVNIYRFSRVISLTVLAVVAVVAVEFGVEVLFAQLNVTAGGVILGASLGELGFMRSQETGLGTLLGGGVVWLILAGILSIITMYIYKVILLVIINDVKNIVSPTKKELSRFLLFVLDTTILKTKEIYGEEVANKATQMILDNFVLKKYNRNFLDEQHQKYLLSFEEGKNENNGN